MKKARFSVVLMLLVFGIAFIIWGGIIYYHHPEMEEARRITWEATKSAGVQYILGMGFFIAAWRQANKI